jgi:hypothetical protein
MIESDTGFVAGDQDQAGRSPGAGASAAGGDNIVDLVRQLAGQGSHLAEQQLSLVKAEIREATTNVKTAVGGMVGAAVVGIAGLGVTLMGLAYLLAQAIDNLGLATLIVGAATLVLAAILYASPSKKMSNAHLTPERSQRTLERTPDIARGDLHTEQTR